MAADKVYRISIEEVRKGDGLKQLGDRLGQAESKVQKFGDKLSSAGQKFTRFSALGAAGMGLAVKAASDLNETVSKTDNVFGDSADAVHKFASTAAKDIGQSRRQAEDATSTFGNLFVQLGVGSTQAAKMSMQMVKLSSDFASFHNADITEVIEAQTAAFRGEYDSVQRFVPTINAAAVEQKALAMGLGATTKELDAQDKALAVQALLMEGAGKATGDFARTSDGLANQSRILKAELEDTAANIGQKLIPFALKLVGVGSGLLSTLTDLNPALLDTALATTALLIALGPLMTLGGRAIALYGALSKAAVFLATSQSAVAVASTGAGLAIGGAAAGLAVWHTALRAISVENDKMVDSQHEFVNAQAGAKVSTDHLVSAYMKAAGGLGTLEGTTNDAANAAKAFAPYISQARETLDRLNETTGVSKLRIVDLANEMGVNLGNMSQEAKDKLAAAIAEIGRGVQPTERLKNVTATLKSEVATTAEKFDALREAVDAALGVQLDADEAAIRLREKYDALAASIKENGTSLDINTEKGRANRQGLIDLTREMGSEIDAMVRAGRTTADVTAAKARMVAQLEAVKKQFPALTPVIDRYIADIRSIPNSANTTANVDTTAANNDLTKLEQRLKSFSRTYYTGNVGVRVVGPGGILTNAAGGPVKAGDVSLVGEKGPEIVQFGADGYVIPNHAIRSAAPMTATNSSGGSRTEVNIYMAPGADGEDVVAALEDYLRRGGSPGPATRRFFGV